MPELTTELDLLQEINTKLSALLALIVDLREHASPESAKKASEILASTGLSTAEIASVLGKKIPAVQKELQRARKKIKARKD